MKRLQVSIVAGVLILSCALNSQVQAEEWPTLEEYAAECVLVVKARQVGQFSEKGELSFKVLEIWKGQFDPAEFTTLSPDGDIRAVQGEHGVRVSEGQEIVFFFTRHNQPKGKLARHNTAFSIRKGKIVYASTGDDLRQEISVEDFKRKFEKFKKKP